MWAPVPGANRAAVDRLDVTTRTNQTRQLEPFDEGPTLEEMAELLGESRLAEPNLWGRQGPPAFAATLLRRANLRVACQP